MGDCKTFNCIILGIFFILIANKNHSEAQLTQKGSVANAAQESKISGIGFGNLFGLTSAKSNSQSSTSTNGQLNSATNSETVSHGVNVAGLKSTVSGTKKSENGQLSQGVEHDVDIGGRRLGTSLSNKFNPIGFHKKENGKVELGLGLLSFNVGDTPKSNENTPSASAKASATGEITSANAQAKTKKKKLGLLDTFSSESSGNAFGSSKTGAATALVDGHASDRIYRSVERIKRDLENILREKRQRPRSQRRRRPQRPQYPQYSQYPQQGPGSNIANSQGIANNQNPYYMQSSGAQTQSQNIRNPDGSVNQGNSGSSIASNLANDGSSGQLSAANVAQNSYQNDQGFGNKNNAQSQSANFRPGEQQLANSNAGTNHIRGPNGERIEAQGGSTATNQNQFGTSVNTAQVNTASFNENGVQGSMSGANSQSIFQGNNGNTGNANTGANSKYNRGPDGSINSSASSSANSNSNGGDSNSFANSDSSPYGTNANAGSNAGPENEEILEQEQQTHRRSTRQAGTFGFLLDALSNLFASNPPQLPPPQLPPPHPPPHRPPIYPQPPYYPYERRRYPCCYSCSQQIYPSCQFTPFGGNIGGGIYGGGIPSRGSYYPYTSATASGRRDGDSSGTVLDIGPILYTSSSTSIGRSLLSLLFG